MAKGLVTDTYLSNIADAIRTKNGTETQYKPSEMASAISSISTRVRPDYVSFYQYGGTSLDISWLDTSNITSMKSMFASCTNLTGLNLTSLDTSKATNMSNMFSGDNKLTTLDLTSFDTSKVTNMEGMFYNCISLTTLTLTSFNISEVTNMNYMFRDCNNLTTLDISSFDFSKVTNMSNAFNNCGSNLSQPTTVYVKNEAAQQKVLSATGTPSNWSTDNVIIKEATT